MPSFGMEDCIFCCTSQSTEIGGVDFLQYPAGLDFFHCMSQSRPSIHCLHSGWTVFFVARRNGQNGRRPFPQIPPDCIFCCTSQPRPSIRTLFSTDPAASRVPLSQYDPRTFQRQGSEVQTMLNHDNAKRTYHLARSLHTPMFSPVAAVLRSIPCRSLL